MVDTVVRYSSIPILRYTNIEKSREFRLIY
jgi:hypothetical protein